MQTANPSSSLFKKIAAIQKIGAAEKSGQMSGRIGNYNYHTIDGVLDYLRPLFAEHGLIMLYSTTSSNLNRVDGINLIDKEVELTIFDIESGESFRMSETGLGVDKQDKGPGKATSYALKTALVGLFMLKGLPDENTTVVEGDKITSEQSEHLFRRCEELGVNKAKFLAFAKAKKFDDILASRLENLNIMLDQKESLKENSVATA